MKDPAQPQAKKATVCRVEFGKGRLQQLPWLDQYIGNVHISKTSVKEEAPLAGADAIPVGHAGASSSSTGSEAGSSVAKAKQHASQSLNDQPIHDAWLTWNQKALGADR